VHAAVPEDPARSGQVRGRRGSGIHRRRADRVHPPQLAAGDGQPGGDKAGVEPAVVADLDRHAGLLDRGDDVRRLGRGAGDGLLAEDRDPGLDRGQDQLRVSVSGRRDDHAVHPGAQHILRRAGRLRRRLGGDPLGRGRDHVGDDERGVIVPGSQPIRVDCRDAAEPTEEQLTLRRSGSGVDPVTGDRRTFGAL